MSMRDETKISGVVKVSACQCHLPSLPPCRAAVAPGDETAGQLDDKRLGEGREGGKGCRPG